MDRHEYGQDERRAEEGAGEQKGPATAFTAMTLGQEAIETQLGCEQSSARAASLALVGVQLAMRIAAMVRGERSAAKASGMRRQRGDACRDDDMKGGADK